MACERCGAGVEGVAFCGACGSPVAAVPGAVTASTPFSAVPAASPFPAASAGLRPPRLGLLLGAFALMVAVVVGVVVALVVTGRKAEPYVLTDPRLVPFADELSCDGFADDFEPIEFFDARGQAAGLYSNGPHTVTVCQDPSGTIGLRMSRGFQGSPNVLDAQLAGDTYVAPLPGGDTVLVNAHESTICQPEGFALWALPVVASSREGLRPDPPSWTHPQPMSCSVPKG